MQQSRARQQGGLNTDALVTHCDLFATLSDITGIPADNPLDGKSLLPLIDGETDRIHYDPLFWDCGTQMKFWVVRMGDWKLSHFGRSRNYQAYELDEDGLVTGFENQTIEKGMKLFNLKDDPNERNNLLDSNPEKFEQMKRIYTKWRSEMPEAIKGRDVL